MLDMLAPDDVFGWEGIELHDVGLYWFSDGDAR